MDGKGVPISTSPATRSRRVTPVAVQVFPAFRDKASAAWVRTVARAALSAAGAADASGVSVVIADDAAVRSLNAKYHGVRDVTDVLSFAWGHEGHWEGADGEDKHLVGNHQFPFVAPKAKGVGEVILSYPQAARQAAEHKRTPKEEVALLITHGVLHLLGHDHATPSEEKKMRVLEDKALHAGAKRGE